MTDKSQTIRIPEDFTPRQRAVLAGIAQGGNTKTIAMNLSLSPKTVEYHRAKIMIKSGLHDTASLTKLALRIGLVENDV
jgi:DNA-binding NarL/FixJ family response regulator